MPLNPPNKAHGSDMQISKYKKRNSWPPPLPNPGYASDYHDLFTLQIYIVLEKN